MEMHRIESNVYKLITTEGMMKYAIDKYKNKIFFKKKLLTPIQKTVPKFTSEFSSIDPHKKIVGDSRVW